MLKVKLHRTLAMTMLSLILIQSNAYAIPLTVSGVKAINNYVDSVDLKFDKKKFDDLKTSISPNTQYTEDFFYTNSQYLKDLTSEVSYLVSHNILSRDIDISANTEEVKTSNNSYGNALVNNCTSLMNINKSDFLMALSKSVYGVQESRPIVLHTNSYREIKGVNQRVMETSDYIPSSLKELGDSFDFSKGDYSVYVSPNIYELYFSDLLGKGIISIDEFKNLAFRKEYQNNGMTVNSTRTYAQWDRNLGLYSPMQNLAKQSDNLSSFESSPLGSSFVIDGFDWTKTEIDSFSFKRVAPDYFINENINTIDALRYIEKVLKLSEKTMTNTEAELITYKYGANFISKLPESEKNTVMFLVAKGILNFENKEEFGGLYGPLTNKMFYTLMYRLANKDARFDFSKIQLTDSDNYWLKEGLYQQPMKVKTGATQLPITSTTITKVNNSDVSKNDPSLWKTLASAIPSFGLFKNFDMPVIYKDGPETLTKYKIERTFSAMSSENKYFYRSKDLLELYNSKKYKGAFNGEIQDMKYIKDVDNGVDTSGAVIMVTFEIEAATEKAALAFLDANTDSQCKGMTVSASVDAVTKVYDGSKSETYVSASDLKKLSSEIRILDDKHLMNIRTGAEALLLNDHQIALIGNEVVRTSATMVFGLNHEVYYNLKVVAKLMSNSYLDEIAPDSFFISTGMKDEGVAHVVSNSNSNVKGQYIDRTLVANFPNMYSYANGGTDTVKMFNLTQLSRAVTSLISDVSFNDKEGQFHYAMMVVEWRYMLPSGLLSDSISSTNKMPTIRQMSEFLYTRPENKELQAWWDSNLGLSNALCNLAYGTENETYIKSGFLAPNVTILTDTELTDDTRYTMWNNLKFPEEYSSRFIKNKWWKDLFPTGTINDGSFNMLASQRRYEEKIEKKDTTNGYYNYLDYVITPNGAVWERFAHTYNSFYKDDEYTMYIKTRDDSKKADMPLQYNTYKLKEKASGEDLQVYYDSFVTVNGELFYRMVLKNPPNVSGTEYKDNSTRGVHGLAKDDGKGGVTFRYRDTNTLPEGSTSEWADSNGLKTYMKSYIREQYIDPNCTSGLSSEYFRFPETEDEARGLPVTDLIKNAPTNLYSQGSLYKIEANSSKISPPQDISNETNGTVSADAHPVVYLSAYKWKLNTQSGYLERVPAGEQVNPFTLQNNVLATGLNSAMIDSILAQSYNMKITSDLPDKATVIIGDTKFVADGGYLNSYPISGQTALEVASIDFRNKPQDIATVLTRMFSGQNLMLKSKSGTALKVSQNNMYYPLEAYITEIGLGSLPDGATPNKTLVDSGGGIAIVGQKNEGDNSIASICMKVRFNNAVRFKLIDPVNNEYGLVYTTEVGADGYMDNIPYFTENMSLDFYDDIFARGMITDFKPLDNAEGLFKQFEDKYMRDFEKDTMHVIKNVLLSIIGYFCVMSFIVYFVQSGGIMNGVLLSIKYPEVSRDREGLDVLKILTFGLFDLETKIPLNTLAVGLFLASLIFGIVVKYL